MATENPEGASKQDNEGGKPPEPSGGIPPVGDAPKFEVKTEGEKQVMTVDGKKVVFESDLIAAKKSLESQMESAQQVHNEAIDKAKTDLSESQTSLATANADVTRLTGELEQARKSGGASSEEDVPKLKQDLEAATSRADTATAATLDYRKKLIIATYPGQVTEEQLEDKTPEQLDAFEEALKALAVSRGGIGPYALGGDGGGAEPLSEMDRAKSILNNTAVVGGKAAPTPPPQQ